jgi:sugar/nucleoside kinase (ribokinase family)
MIVVVGLPAYADSPAGASPAGASPAGASPAGSSPAGEKCAGGMAVEVAAAAQRRGSQVELVGKVGEDGAGDAVVLALGRLGIGHAALLRDPVRPTPVLTAGAAIVDDSAEVDADTTVATVLPANPAERPSLDAADIELALRYLPAATVIVLTDPLPDGALAVAVEAATFATARLIVVVAAGAAPPEVSIEATVLEAPADDDGSFGRLVGTFAAALDAGADPAAAFLEAVTASGWEPAAD